MRAVAFQFDGAVHSFESGWKGLTAITDAPFDGVIPLIAGLVANDVTVFLVSTRVSGENGVFAMKTWMATVGFSQAVINRVNYVAQRPEGISLIDRFAYGFPGHLPALEEIVPEAGAFNAPHNLQLGQNVASSLRVSAQFLNEWADDFESRN